LFILPINRDDFVGGRRPDVYIALFVINAIVLALTYLLSDIQQVFLNYGFIPAQPQLSRVFASMFIHAGLWHFAGNMFFLWMFAYRVESTFGRWLFAVVYLLCGCGAAALHWAFDPSSTIPCGGASGAISGIAGCYLVLFPKSRFDIEVFFWRFHVKTIPARTTGAIGIWIAEQIVLGLISEAVRFSSTAFWAHIGGFAAGVLIAFILMLVAPQLRQRGEKPFMVRIVKGLVFNAKGKPVTNAHVQVANECISMTAVTSSGGRFEIPAVPDGRYTLHVTSDGAAPFLANVLVNGKGRFRAQMKIHLAAREPDTALAHTASS
jgi:membrane associated rhomboid family serine protease